MASATATGETAHGKPKNLQLKLTGSRLDVFERYEAILGVFDEVSGASVGHGDAKVLIVLESICCIAFQSG